MASSKNNNILFGSLSMYRHLRDHDYIKHQRAKPNGHVKKQKRQLKITDIKAIYNCLACGYRTMNRDVLQKHICIKDLIYTVDKNFSEKVTKEIEICSKHDHPVEESTLIKKLPKSKEIPSDGNTSAEKSKLSNHTNSKDIHFEYSIQNECIDCITPKVNINTSKYKCSKCSYSTQNITNLKIHMHIHSRIALYKCTECQFSGADLKQLIKHYNDVKEMQCQCGYATHVKQHMAMHMRSHTGEKPFVCGICNYSASDRAGLHRHMKTKHVLEKHQRAKPNGHVKKQKRQLKITDIKAIYNCLACGYRTMNRDVLQKHICIKDLIYTVDKNFSEKVTKEIEICSKHDHPVEESTLIKKLPKSKEIPSDGNTSAEKSKLSNHTNSKDIHFEYSIQNECIDCITPKVNINTSKYKCSKCSYSTQNITNLKIHMHIHSRIALYKCTECQFSGADLKQLIKHYNDVKEMQCQCGYATHVKQHMAMHMRSHTGEKPFVCGICNYSASDRAGLHRHMKTKHVLE